MGLNRTCASGWDGSALGVGAGALLVPAQIAEPPGDSGSLPVK